MDLKAYGLGLLIVLMVSTGFLTTKYLKLKGQCELLQKENTELKAAKPVVSGSNSTTIEYVNLTAKQLKELEAKYGAEKAKAIAEAVEKMTKTTVVSTTNTVVTPTVQYVEVDKRKNLISGGYYWKDMYAIEYQRSVFKNVYLGAGILFGNTDTRFGIKAGIKF